MKTLRTTIVCLLIIAISGTVGWALRSVQPQTLPSIEDIQKLVGCEKIDGILGDETQRLWDRAINQQYADVWNFYYED